MLGVRRILSRVKFILSWSLHVFNLLGPSKNCKGTNPGLGNKREMSVMNQIHHI